MWNKIFDILFIERPYSAKILMGMVSVLLGFMYMFVDMGESRAVHAMEHFALLKIWAVLFIFYGASMLSGVFFNSYALKMLSALFGIPFWFGLAFLHIYQQVISLAAIYMVFGLFSIWHTLVIYEQVRIYKEHKIDITYLIHNVLSAYLKQYRKR